MANAYDVRVLVRGPREEDGPREMVRREYAASPFDAIQQATLNAQMGEGIEVLKLVHIGPPEEEVEAAARSLLERVRRETDALLEARGKGGV